MGMVLYGCRRNGGIFVTLEWRICMSWEWRDMAVVGMVGNMWHGNGGICVSWEWGDLFFMGIVGYGYRWNGGIFVSWERSDM